MERRTVMRYLIVVVLMALIAAVCSAQYTQAGEDRQDSLPPPMSIQDVIDLSKAKVGEDVILNQIKSTRSAFELTSKDILDLKKEGVSDRVISAMISTAESPRDTRRPSPYAYRGWYNPW